MKIQKIEKGTCMSCCKGQVTRVTLTQYPVTVGGVTKRIPSVHGEKCDQCDITILEEESVQKIQELFLSMRDEQARRQKT